MISAGPRRHRVAFQSLALVADAAGQMVPSDDWATFASRWARVTPLSGRELERARQMQADVTHKIECLAMGLTVTRHHQAAYDGREFAIRSVLNVGERNESLEILATERV